LEKITYFIADFLLGCKDFETFFIPNFQVLQLEIYKKCRKAGHALEKKVSCTCENKLTERMRLRTMV